jgi:leader peptidase (prepilin peptidase)/N-methyltransferase
MWFTEAAVGAGIYGLVAGALVPALIARIPEPETAEAAQTDADLPSEGEPAGPPEAATAKERYRDIAARRGLRWQAVLATGAVSALVGGSLGWQAPLVIFLYLAPVGVALAVVDWRTRLLPTKLIAPSYAAVIVLAAFAAWTDGDWSPLLTAGWGWLVAGGTFFVLWFVYPRGMGYGDVRLSGVLGLALGYLGWGPLLTGVYAGFVVGGLGGLVLSLLRVVDRRAYPFGPFMLVGALVGVLVGPHVAAWYA